MEGRMVKKRELERGGHTVVESTDKEMGWEGGRTGRIKEERG